MKCNDIARPVRLPGLACMAAVLAAPFAWAGVEPTPFRTGLFGVTSGQAVRISVVNTGGTRSIITPCFRIRDASGRLLFETDGGPLPRGVGTAVEFVPVPEDGIPATRVTARRRVQLRVEVALPIPEDGLPGPGCLTPVPEDGLPVPDDGQPVPDDGEPARGGAVLRRLVRNVISTLEVFDIATGRTIYTMPFAAVAGVDPQPF